MFVHVFLFRWQPGVSTEQRARAAEAVRAFQDQIPGLVATTVGENLSPRGGAFTFGGVMQFTDRDAFTAYVTHPAHEKLLEWLMPLTESLELDIQG